MKILSSKIHEYYDLAQNYFASSSVSKILDVGRIVQSFEKNSYYELVLSIIFLTVIKVCQDYYYSVRRKKPGFISELKIKIKASLLKM